MDDEAYNLKIFIPYPKWSLVDWKPVSFAKYNLQYIPLDDEILILSLKAKDGVKQFKIFDLMTVFDFICSVAKWESDKLFISGRKDDAMLCRIVFSTKDGHVDPTHNKKCPGVCLTGKGSTVYVSLQTSNFVAKGFHAFDILKSNRPKFVCQRKESKVLRSVLAVRDYLCLCSRDQFMDSDQLVTIHSKSTLLEMVHVDQYGLFHTTRHGSKEITFYELEYPHQAGTFICDSQKLQFLKGTRKEVSGFRAICQGIRDEKVDIESCNNWKWLPFGQISMICRVQPFHYDGKNDAEKEKNIIEHMIVDITGQTFHSSGSEINNHRIEQVIMEVTFKKPLHAAVKTMNANAETLKVTGLASDCTEAEDLFVKNENLEITTQAQTLGGTDFEDLHGKKGPWEDTAKTVICIEEENLSVEEGMVKFTNKGQQNLMGMAEIRSAEESAQTTVESTHPAVVERFKTECNVTRNKKLGNYDDRIPSNEPVKEQYFNDCEKVHDQSFLWATCKSVGHANEDRGSDHSYYQDIHEKGNDARNRTISRAASEELWKKNLDFDINLSFRDPGLSEEKGEIEPCFQEDRKWPKSTLLVTSVQQEFTPLTSTDKSQLLVKEVNDVIPQKCEEIYDKTFDNYWAVTETPSDFISIEYEKKKSKAFGSKLHFTTNDNNSSFVPRKSSKINAEIKIHPLDRDVALLKEKCKIGINRRTMTDIDLRKKNHYLSHNVWFSRNWFPLPRLSRDEIVGFVAEQTRDGHFGSTLPPAEHKELREILQLLASDNIPGPRITMRYEILRLNTMKTFPSQDRPFAIRIVGAGFYYAGHQDQVVCYCCGNIKDSWVLGDIPLLIHQNMAPDCDFLTQNALVNVPIRKANSTESPSLAEVRLLSIQRSYESNQSVTAQGESPLMIHSSESGQLQHVSDQLQTVSVHADSMGEPQPKYPQYAVRNARINSFQGWPVELQQRPEEMAECGFYYAGFDDCVRCFHCGVGLRHWMSEDDPWIEHARWSASCLYVLKIKGEEFVSLIKMAVEIAEREEAERSKSGGNLEPENSHETALTIPAKDGASSNSTTVKSTPSKDIPTNIGATGSDATGTKVSTPWGNSEIQKYLLTDAAQSVLEMGYQPKLVQQALERVFSNKGAGELTGQIILEAVFEIEEETKVQPKPQQSTHSAEGHESVGKVSEATENKTSEDSQLDIEKIIREHRELREATLCKICMENTISIVFLPCGHLVTCPDCAPAMRKCPICRTLIKGTVKIYNG